MNFPSNESKEMSGSEEKTFHRILMVCTSTEKSSWGYYVYIYRLNYTSASLKITLYSYIQHRDGLVVRRIVNAILCV